MSEKLDIRAMEITDLPQALELWRDAFNSGYSASFDTVDRLHKYLVRNPNLSTVACNRDGKILGALLCGHDGRRGSIYHTAVKPEYRKLGIGKAMEARAVCELKKLGITTGFLFINVKNPGSKAFWESIGWNVIEDVKYLYKQF